MVDLPEPDLPTMATVSFLVIEKFKLVRTGSFELYAKETSENLILPKISESNSPISSSSFVSN